MLKNKVKNLVIFNLLIVISLVSNISDLNVVLAQDESAGVAIYVPISDNPVDGTVVCGTEGGVNKACDREYDPNMIGVVTNTPAVSFSSDDLTGSVPILNSGKVYVLVSAVNGPIKIGDFVTSSKVVGVAQKASKSGYIIGSALEEYSELDLNKTGKILVSLTLKPAVLKKNAEANLMQMVKDGVEGAFESPLSALRYLSSALIVCVVLIYGFIHFGRIAKSGVDAIGRNPLATKSIQVGVLMNMGITIIIMGLSVFVAYMILVI